MWFNSNYILLVTQYTILEVHKHLKWHCLSDLLLICALKVDMNFMKKIPPGAEASNVLVGEVDFLECPIIAFIRLSPAVLLTGLTEVPVPTR